MRKLNFSDVKQNTDEWYNLRASRLTGSKLSVIMAKYGSAFGDPAKRYAVDIAVEQITGKPIASAFSSYAMEKGHELEPMAIALYEELTFTETTNGGFYYDDFIGVSVDANVYDEGIVEVKSAISPAAHYDRIRKNAVDSAYKWQVIGNLHFTGRDWIDFVSYCPDYPADKQLFILRKDPDDFKEEFKMIDDRVEQFRGLVEETRAQIERG